MNEASHRLVISIGGNAQKRINPLTRSAALVGLIILNVTPTHALGVNLVLNGDFETVDESSGLVNTTDLDELGTSGKAKWDVYRSIPGWTSTNAGIEIQTNGTLGSFQAESGSRYVELDSHPRAASNSTMSQTISLNTGSYEFSFYYSPRVGNQPSSPDNTNIIDYSLGALLNGSVSGPSNTTSVGDWTLISQRFEVAADGNFVLTFAAGGTEDTLGGLIDSVSIAAVPLPAAAWLFGSAIVGMIGLGRRKS